MHNRLSQETSPYLLQHAGNPVDWFPWGEEAFAKAQAEDKPVFLSIGYSSCHWCHVMAHQCFEDGEVAALMNDTFVSVKVDREELPHIDHIYMQACQLLTGSGGWPLTVIMTPGKQPFFAATYLPKHTRQGLMGMMELIPVVNNLWKEKRDRVISEAAEITRLVRRACEVKPGQGLRPQLLEKTYGELKARFDPEWGGVGAAPKFPMPHNIMFLLRYFRRTGDDDALAMAVKTLEAMRAGGIYDHVGSGFHRYSTDREWLVPHFEKMLYDQALLAMAYTEAFQLTGREDFRDTAEDIIAYVLRDLRTEDGVFAGAEDADSEGEEGKFYLWSTSELRTVLEGSSYSLAREVFDLQDDGNFRGGDVQGLNIIHQARDTRSLAEILGKDADVLQGDIRRMLADMRKARLNRAAPFKDTKALADWNGLMIAALAKAGAAFDRPDFTAAAEQAAGFILENMVAGGRLRHVFMHGQARGEAGLDDYAFLSWGFIELYEATFEQRYLDQAANLTSVLLEHFWDSTGGGFYSTGNETAVPIARTKTAYDNAVPSGNSVAMLSLVRLAGLLGDRTMKDRAFEIGTAFSGQAEHLPSAYVFLMCGLDALSGPGMEVVIAVDPACSDARAMIHALRTRFLPHAVYRLGPEPAPPGFASGQLDMPPVNGLPTAYVCSNSSCREPTTEVSKMLEYLA
ncbi:MAG: thioredoxin domain-containing protein [Desulfobacterota bacterium]|nr:thioredoxin domain-containing protein [Thermodesulfobacteriota bacterium]